MYGKLFTSMWDGSLYGHLEASAVLMACVTLCNADGVLDMTPEAISGRTGWPLDFIKKGLAELEKPDSRSRTPDDDGRRLVLLDAHRDWGWLIVNYSKYRGLRDVDTIKEQTRNRVSRLRERRKAVTHGNADVTHGNAQKRQAEAEAEAIRDTSSSSTSVVFEHWKSEYGHPKAKLDAKRKRVISAALQNYSADDLKRAISGYKHSPHHMGKNERATVYDDIEIFLRDAKHIDAGLKFAEKGSEVKWL